MILQVTQSAPGLEYGALGLVAMVVIYVVYRLVNWMTNTLNGKLDRIANNLELVVRATDANTVATRELTGGVQRLIEETKELAQTVEQIDRRLP